MSTYTEWAETHTSDINGDGWGSDHLWHYEGTPSNSSKYKCARCFWNFSHYYNHTPDIFKAMRAEKVPDKCSRQQLWPIRLEYADDAERDKWGQVRAAIASAEQQSPSPSTAGDTP